MTPLLALVVLLASISQLLVKRGADRSIAGPEDRRGLLRRFCNLPLVLGALLAAGLPLLYSTALRELPLSIAYAANGLSYPLVLGGSALFLGERLNRRHLLGSLCICCGFFLWTDLL